MKEEQGRPRALTPKEERFCQEYVTDLNGTQAATRAGYSERSAAVTASRLLIKANVVQKIQVLMDERSKRTAINADTILRELLRLATVDVTEAFDDMGQLKPISEIPEDVRRAIAGLEVHELFDGQGDQKSVIGLAKKVKFWDKPKALELLAKHLKLLTDKVEHSGTITLESLVAGSKEDK